MTDPLCHYVLAQMIQEHTWTLFNKIHNISKEQKRAIKYAVKAIISCRTKK